MVEPALWGRRHMGSTPSHQGVCGRHGGEERQWPREAWYRPSGRYGWNRATLANERARNRQRKARPEAPMVGADISASEIPTEAVPGVGSGRGTQERGQSKRPRIAAGRAVTPVGSKRPTGGGRPRAVWQRRRATRG